MSGRARLRSGAGVALALCAASCGQDIGSELGPSTFHVEITSVNGLATLPTADKPLPANHGDTFETWGFSIEARTPDGKVDTSFNGYVRLSTQPGAVTEVMGDAGLGRNVLLKSGKATGTAQLTAVYGPSRLWVEDLGYLPAAPGKKPACSDGTDNNGNTLVDFPAEPGCAFADDDSEDGGSYVAGVSAAVQYALPRITDVQGNGPATPYPFEAIELNAAEPQRLIVTRVASDGFYVTDVNAAEMMNGYNHIYAFNFSTPAGMRVCDRLTYLSGTLNEFFGFTELSFPSYQLDYVLAGQGSCEIPEPPVLDASIIKNHEAMEKLESGLVRIQGYHIAKNFGPNPIKLNVPASEASSCDLNGDGQVDFDDPAEGGCSKVCDADPECSEYTAYSARGAFKVSKGPNDMIKIQTGTVSGFDPLANKGQVLDAVTGTLREFSGGTLNWTIETRCPDDLVCALPGCAPKVLSSQEACVRLRTVDDNDQGTN